eukprot:12459-Heterococcus_DN1.PRE.1
MYSSVQQAASAAKQVCAVQLVQQQVAPPARSAVQHCYSAGHQWSLQSCCWIWQLQTGQLQVEVAAEVGCAEPAVQMQPAAPAAAL